MRKVTQNYVLFALLFFLGLFQALSGFIMWFILPHGGGGWRGGSSLTDAVFLGLVRDTWRALHDWVAAALLVVVILHIIVHWNWIWRMTKSYFRRTG
jgi:predicted permease